MVPVRRVEQAGDSPWIWCVLGGLQLWAKRKTHQQREDCSEYDISSFHDLIFPFLLLLFWPSLISRWRIQFRLFVLPGPKQYPDPRAVLPEMRVECQEEKLDFFFGGGKSPKHPPSIAAATEGVAGAVGCGYGEPNAISNAIGDLRLRRPGTRRLFDLVEKIEKRCRRRIRTAEYWRAAHPGKQSGSRAEMVKAFARGANAFPICLGA